MKKNVIAQLRRSLTTPLSMAAIGLFLGPHTWAQISLPSMAPGTTEQAHFLLEEPSISRSTLHDIGRSWGQSSGAMVLALVEGTPSSSLPWPASMPDEFEGNDQPVCILRASRTWWPNDGEAIHFHRVVVPEVTFPPTWAELGGVTALSLTVNGVQHSLEPDVPFVLPSLSDGVTLTSFTLDITLGDGSTRTGGLVLPTRSICPQPMPDLPPWPIESADNPWWVGTFHEGVAVTGSALVRLGSDGQFDSPVILCDGFDPDLHQHAVAFGHGDQNWETLWDCDRSYRLTLDSLHAIGKDVVFLDFADGTRDVRANAALLAHVIALCNGFKTTPTPLAVIGVSMGGVIARLALREMEINGDSHCTGLFVAFDSPMRGAYLPWSMLQAIDFFAGLSAQAEDLHEALQSTAAQQLLFLTPSGVPNAHASLQVGMVADGLPQWPKCAAIVNSHPNANFPLGPGPLLQASESIFGWEYAHVQLNPLPGDPNHSASTSSHHVSFDADIPNANWWFGDPLVYSQTGFCSNAAPQVGKWPGSSTAHLEAFESALEAGGIGVTISQSETMFIPTKSALDVPYSGQTGDSPFDWIHTESIQTGSTAHCDLTNHHEELMNWVVAATALDQGLYGHNWPHRQLIATSQAQLPFLTIGASGSNLVGNSSEPFETELSPCSEFLTVDSLLRLGDDEGQHPGVLLIHAGQTLRLGTGASLVIGPGSGLIVEAGGHLDIQSEGQTHIQGLLHLKSGGQLSVSDLTKFHVNGVFQCAGHWVTSANAHAECLMAPNGIITISGATFTIPEGSTLQFEGTSGWGTDIQIEPDSSCLFTGSGDVKFSANHLWLGTGSHLHFDGVFARIAHCEIQGPEAVNATEWPQINSNNRLRLSHTDMSHCILSGALLGQQALTVWACTFEEVRIEGSAGGANLASSEWIDCHIQWFDTNRPIHIHDNAFVGGFDDGIPLISLDNCPDGALRDNTISHHREGLRLLNASAQLGCNDFERLETAIVLLSEGFVQMNGTNNGGNSFAENDVHIRCHTSPLPAIAGGENAWGQAFQERFAGSAWAEPGPGGTPAPLDASGNAWPNPNGDQVPPILNSGLTACNPSFENQSIGVATDDPIAEANCSSSPHTPSDQGAVKSNLECPSGIWFPNPASDVIQFECPDKSFSVAQLTITDFAGGRIHQENLFDNQYNINSLHGGVYILSTQLKSRSKSCLLRQRLFVMSSD